jgi:hypothetical protein
LVDRDGSDNGAAFAKSGEKFGIGDAVFLNGDLFVAKIHVRGVDGVEKFAPSVGFGGGESNRDIPFAKDGYGLWSASDDGDFAEGVDELFLRMRGLDNCGKGTRTDPGKEDYGVELILEEGAGEMEGFRIGREWDFTHGRSMERFAAVSFDEASDFLAATALESEDCEGLEVGGGHVYSLRNREKVGLINFWE